MHTICFKFVSGVFLHWLNTFLLKLVSRFISPSFPLAWILSMNTTLPLQGFLAEAWRPNFKDLLDRSQHCWRAISEIWLTLNTSVEKSDGTFCIIFGSRENWNALLSQELKIIQNNPVLFATQSRKVGNDFKKHANEPCDRSSISLKFGLHASARISVECRIHT